jgi:hypothetical protein
MVPGVLASSIDSRFCQNSRPSQRTARPDPDRQPRFGQCEVNLDYSQVESTTMNSTSQEMTFQKKTVDVFSVVAVCFEVEREFPTPLCVWDLNGNGKWGESRAHLILLLDRGVYDAWIAARRKEQGGQSSQPCGTIFFNAMGGVKVRWL